MEFKQGLSQRIVIAFVLMTLLVGGAFGLGIVQAVHVMEQRLLSGVLRGDLDRLLLMDSVDEWRHKPQPDQWFHFSGGPGRFALPAYLQGFKAGADDYLIKPFALSELTARIEAVLRRAQGGGKRCLQVADLAYDLDTLEVTRAGRLLKLNPVGLKLLAVLMQKSPHVLRREVLEEALWGDDCPDSDSLRSHIHQLRQVIDKPFPRPLLQTLHGVGYRLAEVADGV